MSDADVLVILVINGVSLDPAEKAIANGKKLVDYRARITVMAIEKAIASAERH